MISAQISPLINSSQSMSYLLFLSASNLVLIFITISTSINLFKVWCFNSVKVILLAACVLRIWTTAGDRCL